MKKSKFNETKVLSILKEAEAGMTVAEISRKYGISNGTFYNWKSKFAGMSGSEIRRMRQLEDENKKLKHMYADLSLENNVLKELIEKNF
ncbi:MAG: transposase [Desulfobulbaceae bacterium]|nr:transposase [Desulfobulbaceae bacterium]